MFRLLTRSPSVIDYQGNASVYDNLAELNPVVIRWLLKGCMALFALGGARLQTPDLKRWNEGEPVWASPALLARTRHPQQQAPPRAREAESVRR